jgi:HSP20 family protein
MASEPTRRSAGSVPARQAWWAVADPSVELQHLWGEVSRLFERAAVDPEATPRHWMPLAEEEDRGDAYVVRAELPGVPRDRVQIELDGKELHISGSVDESSGAGALNRRRGSFSYGIRVPGDVSSEGINATLNDGVLTVLLPKSGEPTRRTIDIGVSGSRS